MVVLTALPQNDLGSLPIFKIHRTLPTIVRFIHSAMPLCCGTPGIVFLCPIRCFEQYSLNSLEMYSPPWFVWRSFSGFPISLPTMEWNCWKYWNAWFFVRIRYTHVFYEMSSIRVTKYLLPPNKSTSMGLQTS